VIVVIVAVPGGRRGLMGRCHGALLFEVASVNLDLM